MMRFINCLLVAFILQPMEIDASVNIYPIGENAGNNNFICGEKLVLNCQITSNPLAMTWRNESSLIPIAECISNTCTLNPSVANEYEFSTDTSSGIYNLTFNVTNFNNGTSYECGNGSTSDISLVLVKDFRPAVIESTDKRLQVMSGCISSSVDVAFKWMKLKASNKEESTYDTTCSNEQYSTDTTTCSLDEKCGGSTLVRKLMSIEEDQEGTDYYLKAILSYDGFVVESPITSNTYKIKDSCYTKDDPYLISILALLVIDLLYISVAVITHFLKKDLKRCIKMVYWFSCIVLIAQLVSFVLFFVAFVPCHTDSCCKCRDQLTHIAWFWIATFFCRIIAGIIIILKIGKPSDTWKGIVLLITCVPVIGIIILILFCLHHILFVHQMEKGYEESGRIGSEQNRQPKKKSSVVPSPTQQPKTISREDMSRTDTVLNNCNWTMKPSSKSKSGQLELTRKANAIATGNYVHRMENAQKGNDESGRTGSESTNIVQMKSSIIALPQRPSITITPEDHYSINKILITPKRQIGSQRNAHAKAAGNDRKKEQRDKVVNRQRRQN